MPLEQEMLAFTRALRLGITASGYRKVTTMGRKQFYAVVRGKRPGLYRSWEECSAQVNSVSGSLFKGFGSEEDAMQYLQQHGIQVQQQPPPLPSAAAAKPPTQQPPHLGPSGAVPSTRKGTDEWLEAGRGLPSGVMRLNPCRRTLRLEFDGASKRNPGPAGFGAVLYDDLTDVEVARLCQYMGSMHTNNQAEYAGLVAGLQAALELGCEHIQVRGDSTLIINQVLGKYMVKNEGLMPYHAAALNLSRRFKSFRAQQVPREENKVADALSNEAIANYISGRNPHVWTLAGCARRSAQLAAGLAAGQGGGGEEEEEEWAEAGAPIAPGEREQGEGGQGEAGEGRRLSPGRPHKRRRVESGKAGAAGAGFGEVG